MSLPVSPDWLRFWERGWAVVLLRPGLDQVVSLMTRSGRPEANLNHRLRGVRAKRFRSAQVATML